MKTPALNNGGLLPEPFVDAITAADFLDITRRYLLDLARSGVLPAYPLGNGKRRVWRFRLSDLAKAMETLAAETPGFTSSAR